MLKLKKLIQQENHLPMIEEVEAFIFETEDNQQALMLYVHDLLMSQSHVTCKIRYRVPSPMNYPFCNPLFRL